MLTNMVLTIGVSAKGARTMMCGGDDERLPRNVVGGARQRMEYLNHQIGMSYKPGCSNGTSK